ncbi:MAG: Rrf2 family transcriptional regulator [Oscillospiraceae bacterium]|nr:Rrf2 family transcriptional regulator [Oscillospiraceae bacterium]
MHLTLESDYAVRIVYVLAKNKTRMDAKAISEVTGVTLRFSLKILRKLVGAGITKSFKGTQGGYELAGNPAEISVYDVVSVIEGPINISRCIDSDFICTRAKEKPCEFRKGFQEVSAIVKEKLSAMTFDKYI